MQKSRLRYPSEFQVNGASGQARTVGETINTWAQTIAILLAGFWGIYTFIYKEVMVPKSAPVNICLNLEVKKIDSAATSAKNLTAVEMKVSANNPSTREIHLLSSGWTAYAMAAMPVESDLSHDSATAKTITTPRDITTLERHAKRKGATLVALGQLYGDVSLKPGENLTRRIVFHVPRNKYDLVEVRVSIPSATNVDGVGFKWVFEDDSLQPRLFRVDRGGNEIDLLDTDCFAKDRGIQTFETRVEASLWP